ncbi:Phage tail protein (Tail_P2_I) [uncultured archaeon]|nr:Phage tail protein (Tail_P2_I) [uncultured archaeon]
MIQEESRSQIWRTGEQWDSGLAYRLEKPEGGGLTLYSIPTFDGWVDELGLIQNAQALAVDPCGLICVLDSCKLYRYDPNNKRTETIPYIGGCGPEAGQLQDPARIVFNTSLMWVLDSGNHRVQAFSMQDFQIRYIIGLKEPVDIGLDKQGYLYAIDKKGHTFKILTFDTDGRPARKQFEDSFLKEPLALAVGKDGDLYVIDRKQKGFIRFTNGKFTGILGDFSKIFRRGRVPSDLGPADFIIDRNGNMFVSESREGLVHQFDPDGNHTGTITIIEFKGLIHGLAVDYRGNLYAGTDKGIAFFATEEKYTTEKGIYYTRTLDSGIRECQWHRLSMLAALPARSVLEISFYSSDMEDLKSDVDAILSDSGKTSEQKVAMLDEKIPWIGPERYSSSPDPGRNQDIAATGDVYEPRSMLLKGKKGRYLWLKITFLTFDDEVRPAVSQMKIVYPRISYLRYLPAIYQEDAKSEEFLERFLSLFETVFSDLENEISHVFRYFDPDTSPQDFLNWLASWMNMALEEDWPQDMKRQFIREASSLYKQKGTPAGIERLIEIYTGKKPLIIEHSRMGKLMVLGSGFRLGVNSLLIQTPIRGFRLGDDSILGRAALRDTAGEPEDPFLSLAHRFTVILSAGDLKGVERILNDEKPAHTVYDLRGLEGSGAEMYVGINSRVGDYRPICIEQESAIGSGILVTGERHGSRIERRSRLGTDVELI